MKIKYSHFAISCLVTLLFCFGSNAAVTNTLNDALQTDVNGNGRVNPGDTLRYTVVITNNTAGTLSNVLFNAGAITNASLVSGSLKAAPLARSDSPPTNSVPGNSFHTAFNTTLNVPAGSGLLANDFTGSPGAQIASFGGGSFGGSVTANTAGSTQNAAIGALTVNANGSLTFVPAATLTGPVTFQYRLTNSVGASDATVTLAIGNRASATNESFTITGNTTFDSSLLSVGVFSNDGGNAIGLSGNPTSVNGNLTLNANGQFLFTGNAGLTGAASFTYVITNGFGSSTGTVSFTVANKVWYIDGSSVAGTADGRSTTPFKTIAQFNAVNNGTGNNPNNNDIVLLRDGTYIDGFTLRDGQKVFGDGTPGTLAAAFGFSLAAGSVEAAGVAVPNFSGTRPVLSRTSGTAVNLASGNTVRGLNAQSANGRAFSGAAVGSLTISNVIASATGDRAVSLASGTVNVTFDSVNSTNSIDNGIFLSAINGSATINAGVINNAASTAFNVTGGNVNATYSGSISQANNTGVVSVSGAHTGTLTFQTGTLSASNGSGLLFNDADGTYNFNGTTTLNGGSACILITNGSGGSFTFSATTGITNPAGVPAFKLSGGTASVTYNGNITVSSTAVTAVNISGGHATGTVTFQTGTINASIGDGLQFDNADGNYTFASTVTLNGGDAGIDIQNGSSGNFGFTNAPITNPSGAGFRVNGGSGSISHSGNISKSGGGQIVDIQSRTGGSVTINGNVTASGTSGGILLQNNTGSTINFAGTLALNTGANIAFNATGGGTVTATGSGSNTLTTTTGTALNVVNTTIGGGNLNFRSISANGAAKGIILNNTGNGGLVVTGSGTTDGSGGTIQNISQRGIELISAANVSLKNMALNNANTTDSGTALVDLSSAANLINAEQANGAIIVNGVNTLTLDNIDINGTSQMGIGGRSVTNFTLKNSTIVNAGDGAFGAGAAVESGLWLYNVPGTSRIENTDISFSQCKTVNIVNRDVNATITVTNCILRDTQTVSPGGASNTTGEDGFQFQVYSDAAGSPTNTIYIKNTQIRRCRTQGIQAFSGDDAVLNIDITGCTIDSETDIGAGIDINANNTSKLYFNILNNPLIRSRGGAAVNITAFLNGLIMGRVNDNASIVVNGTGAGGSGVRVLPQEDADAIVEVKNNNITMGTGNNSTPIDVQARFLTSRLDITLDNNNLDSDVAAVADINITAGSSTAGENSQVYANILNNDVLAGGPSNILRLRVSDLDATTNPRMFLTGFVEGGAGLDDDAVATWNAKGNTPAASTANVNVSLTGSATGPSAGTALTPANANPSTPAP